MSGYFRASLIAAILAALAALLNAQSNQLAMQAATNSLNKPRFQVANLEIRSLCSFIIFSNCFFLIFQPNPFLQGSGSGNNGRNWGAGVNAGVGMKVWESQNR